MKRILFLFQLLSMAISAGAQALVTENDIATKSINTSKAIGVTLGSSNVSLNGTAAYSIPIYIPDGVRGMQPNVSVNYSSAAGNGLLGFGWNLSAYSSITYDSYNMYNDAMVSPVKINYGAPFSLDGQRLIPVSGNTEFRTESESFSKITTQGGTATGCSSCPNYFKVQTKSGWVMEYGNTSVSSNSRINNASGMPVIWLLSKVYDLYGNYAEYNYGDANGERVLLNITYTKNASFNLNNQIVFAYGNTARTDKNKFFLEGDIAANNADVSKNSLLTKITVIAEGVTVKDYQFNYGNEGMYTYLNEVVETGYDAASFTSLNSTLFKYNTPTAAPASQNFTSSAVTRNPDMYTGDFNGDGYDDIFAAYYTTNNTGKIYDTARIFLNSKSNGFSLAATYKLPTTETFPTTYNLYQTFSIADINGDGRDDIIVELRGAPNLTINYKLKGFATLILNSANNSLSYQTYYLPSYQTIYTGNHFFTGDYNKDGIDDVLLLSGNDKLYMNSPFAATPITNQVWATALYSNGYPTLDDGTIIPYLLNADTVINRDFNGDGYLDFYIVNHTFNFWNTTSNVLDISFARTRILSMEASCYAGPTVIYNNSSPNGVPNTYTGDFNGDGYTDFFGYKSGAWVLSYFKGNSYVDESFTFNEAISTTNINNNTEALKINDYNGDGKSDILHYYSNSGTPTLSIYYSFGYGGTCFKRVDITAPHSFSYKPGLTGDFNADGRADIIDTIANNASAFYILQFQPKGQERLLTKVKDGFQRQTEFKYKLFSEDASFYSYTPGGSTFPLTTLVPRSFGVYRIVAPSGTGNMSDTTYTDFSYAEAQKHAVKGFLGFKTRKSKDAMTSIVTEQTNGIIDNNMTFSLFGATNTKTYFSATPSSLLTQQTIYDTIKDFTNKRYLLKVYKTIELNNVNNSKVINDITMSDSGNVSYSKQSICAQSGDTVQTTTTTVGSFSSNGTWLPSLPELVTQTVKYKSQTPYTTQTNNVYNAMGDVSSSTDFYGTSKTVTTAYLYDATYGFMTKKTITPSGMAARYTKYEYKGNNRTVDKMYISMAGGEQCTQWITSYDKRFNLPTGIQNGLYANYKDSTLYDAWGRPITSLKLPNSLSTSIAYNWNLSGNELYSVTTTPPNAPVSVGYYDRLGRVIRATTQNFNGTTIETSTTYDTLGRVKQSVVPNATSGTVTTVNNYGTISDYFKLRSVNDGFKTVNYDYTYPAGGGANTEVKTKVSVFGGVWKEQSTDAAGRMTKASDAGGDVAYTYNSQGKPTNIDVVNVNGVNTMQYDGVTGWQTQLFDKNAGTTQYRYDNWGQLVWQRDNTGFEDTLTYDDIGRLVKKYRKANGTIPDETIEYIYHTADANGIQQLETVKLNGNIDQKYVYDNWHRPVSSTRYIDGTAYTTRTVYKTDNSIDTIVYPNNFAINYSYTTLGYLEKVKYGSKVLYQTLTTNALNQPTAYSYGNGKNSSITYQADGMPSRYLTSGVQDLTMSFEAATGNLQSRTDNTQSPAQTETFAYNTALDRLNTINKGAATDTIAYDNNGNINKKSKTGNYSYDANKINAVTNIIYTCGNLHPKDSFLNVIKYTPFNQPDSIKQLNAIAGKYYKVGFSYGADHQRSKMVLVQDSITKATRYYAGNYEKFTDSAGTNRHIYYINGGNGLCAIASTTGSATTMYYVYTDHLGSILKMTDSTGVVKGEQSFDAWGRERNYKDWSKDTITQPSGSPFESINSLYGYGNNAGWITRGFTGHEHLPQFDLINMNGRLYDPIVGRMLSPDNNVADITSTQAYNKYSYVANNPLKYTDPSGWLLWSPKGESIWQDLDPDYRHSSGGGGSDGMSNSSYGFNNLTAWGTPMLSSMFYAPVQYNFSNGSYYGYGGVSVSRDNLNSYITSQQPSYNRSNMARNPDNSRTTTDPSDIRNILNMTRGGNNIYSILNSIQMPEIIIYANGNGFTVDQNSYWGSWNTIQNSLNGQNNYSQASTYPAVEPVVGLLSTLFTGIEKFYGNQLNSINEASRGILGATKSLRVAKAEAEFGRDAAGLMGKKFFIPLSVGLSSYDLINSIEKHDGWGATRAGCDLLMTAALFSPVTAPVAGIYFGVTLGYDLYKIFTDKP